MGPVLIGIHGIKQSGKSTALTFIEEWAGALSVSVAGRGFADYAKWMWMRQFYPRITREDAIKYVDTYKETGVRIVVEHPRSPSQHLIDIDFRQCLAQFATEGTREVVGQDFWVDLLLPNNNFYSWHKNFDHALICAITDVRFENEVRRIKELGGYCWKVKREKAVKLLKEQAEADNRLVHASEFGIPDDMFDVVMSNNNSLGSYQETVNKVLAGYLSSDV